MCELVWGELGKFVNKRCIRRKHPLYEIHATSPRNAKALAVAVRLYFTRTATHAPRRGARLAEIQMRIQSSVDIMPKTCKPAYLKESSPPAPRVTPHPLLDSRMSLVGKFPRSALFYGSAPLFLGLPNGNGLLHRSSRGSAPPPPLPPPSWAARRGAPSARSTPPWGGRPAAALDRRPARRPAAAVAAPG